MTTDYETHFAEAKRMYGMSWEDDQTEEECTNLIARAQVHATLALAAATAHGTALDPILADLKDTAMPDSEGY